MPKKTSVRKAADDFVNKVREVEEYLLTIPKGTSDKHITWAYEYAVIRLYREFEQMMLAALVGSINNDSATISQSTGVVFPKHLTDEVCEYLVLGGGYFDFKGRSGLIKKLKRYVPEGHYVLDAVRQGRYKEPIDLLTALRNFAAHESSQSKRLALEATGMSRMSSAGAWLKAGRRFSSLSVKLKELGAEIGRGAPY